MKNKNFIYSSLFFILLLAIILAVIIFYSQKNDLKVIFFDVGQGDAILISEGSNQVLIDGGKDGKLLLEKLGKYIPFWDRKIETIFATHPDQDHIGGLPSVLSAYKVDSVLETKMQSDSQIYKKLEDDITKNNIEKIEAKKDVAIKFPNGAIAEVLYPLDSIIDINAKDTNAASVVVKLTIGENKFLFTGDLPIEQEQEMLTNNVDINAGILKVAHHGSKYATSDAFLDAVKPQDAVISVGKNNSYGHPNQEALQRLLTHKAKIFRTDEIGDIVYECANIDAQCVQVAN